MVSCTSNQSKVKCYSPTGDMSEAPTWMTGSAAAGPRLQLLKVVGCYVGDDAACSQRLVEVLERKLKIAVRKGKHEKAEKQRKKIAQLRAGESVEHRVRNGHLV